jgi:hypothetical protein
MSDYATTPKDHQAGRRAPVAPYEPRVADARASKEQLVRPNPTRRRLVTVGVVLLGASVLAACGSDDAANDPSDRPVVTFSADDTSLRGPAVVPSGFVDIRLETDPGSVDHHMFIARLHDGVTFDDAMSDDESFFTKMTLKGGNGIIASGEDVVMTMHLEPGSYFALDNPQNEESPTAQFTVVEADHEADPPAAKGVVTMGPGMIISVPDDFDGVGTWEFVNHDSADVHEAALVHLVDGKTTGDVATWGADGFEGPPPFDGSFGSMGALGPGERAWITLEPGVPGDYALVCFIPGRDGVPHLAKGMATQVSIAHASH